MTIQDQARHLLQTRKVTFDHGRYVGLGAVEAQRAVDLLAAAGLLRDVPAAPTAPLTVEQAELIHRRARVDPVPTTFGITIAEAGTTCRGLQRRGLRGRRLTRSATAEMSRRSPTPWPPMPKCAPGSKSHRRQAFPAALAARSPAVPANGTWVRLGLSRSPASVTSTRASG